MWRLSLFWFALACSSSLSGAILQATIREDHSGNGVVAAELIITKPGVREYIADIESDGSGRFDPVDLAPGEYELHVTKNNYLPVTMHIQADEIPDRLVLHLVRCGSISGRVTALGGQPLGEVTVVAMTSPDHIAAQTQANEKGEYRLFGLRPGEYTVATAFGQSRWAMGRTGEVPKLGPHGTGMLVHSEKFTITSGHEYRGIDFTVPPRPVFAVRGRVDRESKRLESFWVALAAADRPELAFAVAIASKDGVFEIQGIPTGSYLVFVSGPTGARGAGGAQLNEHSLFARSQLQVIGQNVEGLLLHPSPGLELQVKLRADASCSKKITVTLNPIEDWSANIQRSGEVKADGTISFSELAPAKYRVVATDRDGFCYQAQTPTTDLSGPVTVTLAPASKLRVHVMPPAALELVGTDAVRTAIPNRTGSAEFNGLAPGHYRLRRADGVRGSQEFELEAGAERQVELTIPKQEVRQ